MRLMVYFTRHLSEKRPSVSSLNRQVVTGLTIQAPDAILQVVR